MIIFLKPPYGKVFLKNKVFSINNGSNIFYKFDQKLKKYNIIVNTIDKYQGVNNAKFIYCDVPYPWELGLWLRVILNKKNNILLCLESPNINPFSHMRFIHFFFSSIYSWNNHKDDGKKYHKFYIPQMYYNKTLNFPRFKNKKFLALVNSNKDIPFLFYVLSGFKRDLYKERERLISYFNKKIPRDFYLYGDNWNKRKRFSIRDLILGPRVYKVYRGSTNKGMTTSKIEVLAKFKFCICFENTVAEGYLTEKIFDCFKARCVPIYLGDPSIEKTVDPSCFIDFRNFKNYDDLYLYLKNMPEKKYNEYIRSINIFMKRKDVRQRWFETGVEKIVLSDMKENNI